MKKVEKNISKVSSGPRPWSEKALGADKTRKSSESQLKDGVIPFKSRELYAEEPI